MIGSNLFQKESAVREPQSSGGGLTHESSEGTETKIKAGDHNDIGEQELAAVKKNLIRSVDEEIINISERFEARLGRINALLEQAPELLGEESTVDALQQKGTEIAQKFADTIGADEELDEINNSSEDASAAVLETKKEHRSILQSLEEELASLEEALVQRREEENGIEGGGAEAVAVLENRNEAPSAGGNDSQEPGVTASGVTMEGAKPGDEQPASEAVEEGTKLRSQKEIRDAFYKGGKSAQDLHRARGEYGPVAAESSTLRDQIAMKIEAEELAKKRVRDQRLLTALGGALQEVKNTLNEKIGSGHYRGFPVESLERLTQKKVSQLSPEGKQQYQRLVDTARTEVDEHFRRWKEERDERKRKKEEKKNEARANSAKEKKSSGIISGMLRKTLPALKKAEEDRMSAVSAGRVDFTPLTSDALGEEFSDLIPEHQKLVMSKLDEINHQLIGYRVRKQAKVPPAPEEERSAPVPSNVVYLNAAKKRKEVPSLLKRPREELANKFKEVLGERKFIALEKFIEDGEKNYADYKAAAKKAHVSQSVMYNTWNQEMRASIESFLERFSEMDTQTQKECASFFLSLNTKE